MSDRYPTETLGPDDDDGTMPENVADLAAAVVGHRIVAVEENAEVPRDRYSYWGSGRGLALTLDNPFYYGYGFDITVLDEEATR